jgi:cyclin H
MAAVTLDEDELHRRSTQFRFWSFSREQLAAQRRQTHQLAVARAQQYLQPQQEQKQRQDGEKKRVDQQDGEQKRVEQQDGEHKRADGEHKRADGEKKRVGQQDGETTECLSEDEELRLVHKYCDVLRVTGIHVQWPAHIYTTAIQYFKRFYLNNSCMTYPPKEIYKTVMFLASKTEATHTTLSMFASIISADADAVLAPEYKVMQALRFMLDVRQPYRGLKGALMDLLNMAEGLVDVVVQKQMSGQEAQRRMLQLARPEPANRTQWSPKPLHSDQMKQEQQHLVERIQLAWQAAKNVLDVEALLTDVYFLYTPSQMLFAALHVADTPLLNFYLDARLPPDLPTRSQIVATIQACSATLAAYNPASNITKDERAALEKKLDACRDPSTRNLIQAAAAAKRNGAEEGAQDEHKAQKIRSERAKNDRDMNDLFGPTLPGPD